MNLYTVMIKAVNTEDENDEVFALMAATADEAMDAIIVAVDAVKEINDRPETECDGMCAQCMNNSD